MLHFLILCYAEGAGINQLLMMAWRRMKWMTRRSAYRLTKRDHEDDDTYIDFPLPTTSMQNASPMIPLLNILHYNQLGNKCRAELLVELHIPWDQCRQKGCLVEIIRWVVVRLSFHKVVWSVTNTITQTGVGIIPAGLHGWSLLDNESIQQRQQQQQFSV